MSSDESDLTPESIKLDALGIVNKLLPEKSKEKHLKAYDDFHKWKTAKGAKSVSEYEPHQYMNFSPFVRKYETARAARLAGELGRATPRNY